MEGHQDKKEKYNNLLIEVQCNVDTNWHAGEYQKHHGKQIPLVIQYPSCSAYLITRKKTIKSNYYKDLINAYVEPMFLEYLQQKNKWDC